MARPRERFGRAAQSCSSGFLAEQRAGGTEGGTLLENTCDNDVIWVLAGLLSSC